MVDSKASDSLRDFIPPAFVDDCAHPYGINLKYQELAGDEIEFTYTLSWRGSAVPPRVTEIPDLLGSRKVKKSKKKSSHKSKDKKHKKKKICPASCTKRRSNSTPKTAPAPTPKIANIEITGNLSENPPASPAAISEKDSLHQLKLDLYNNFNCPRYYYNDEKKKQPMPVIPAPKSADDVSSNRSYFGSYPTTPRRKTLLREGWMKKQKKRQKVPMTPVSITGSCRTEKSISSQPTSTTTSSSSDRCDVTQSSGKSDLYRIGPYLEDQVLLNLTLKRPNAETIYMEQFLPTALILHDAVDEILKKKSNRRLMLKSSAVSSVIFLGCGTFLTRARPVSHHEYFCSTLEEMMGIGQEVNITVDLRKKKTKKI